VSDGNSARIARVAARDGEESVVKPCRQVAAELCESVLLRAIESESGKSAVDSGGSEKQIPAAAGFPYCRAHRVRTRTLLNAVLSPQRRSGDECEESRYSVVWSSLSIVFRSTAQT
jgi:hypothetical protein